MLKKLFGLSLRARLFVTMSALVILAVGAAVVVTYVLGNAVAQDAVRTSLARSGWIQDSIQEQRIEQLRLMAFVFAGDPDFSAYIVEAIAGGDSLSLLDQLEERQRDLGYDFAMILDPDGVVVARTDDPQLIGEDLADEPLVVQAFEEFEAYGVWQKDGGIYYAIASPLGIGGVLEGFLIAAYAVDEDTALDLRRASDTDIAFVVSDSDGARQVATTLSPVESEDLDRLLAAEQELGHIEDETILEIALGSSNRLLLARPIRDLSGTHIGMALSIASLDIELEPYRQILKFLTIVGLVAIVLALVVSYILPMRLLQPLRALAIAAQAAAGGDYDQKIDAERSDEVGQLAASFATLLAELREKRDMELYINELSRNMPDQEGPFEEAVPARERSSVWLGLELRDYSTGHPESSSAREVLDAFGRDLRRVSDSIHSHNGTVESLLGHRLLASFTGNRSAERAIASASQILRKSLRHESIGSAAVVLTRGPAYSGSTVIDNKAEYLVTGLTIQHLENLLRVAKSNSLLISQVVREELRETLSEAGVELTRHRSTLSKVPLYSLSSASIERLADPQLSLTQDFTEPLDGTAPDLGRTLSSIAPGRLLGERFEILSVLGSGGMGVVYKARDRTLDELVALKMLKNDAWTDAQGLEGLKGELKLARKIAHPNVLRTFDFGDMDGIPFISMEFVRGITLRQLLDRSGRLPLRAGLRVARQICRGLGAAHAESVLHRDIKPENLIIEHTGNAKLMDFGIALPIRKYRNQDSEAGPVVGTPYYLAPEQLEGKDPDQRADIYACGVVLYEIFTGELPFSASGTLIQIIARKMEEDPTPATTHWSAIPAELDRLIMRCLDRDRSGRFESTESLLEELELVRA